MKTLGILLALAIGASPAAAAPWSAATEIPDAPNTFPIVAESANGPQAIYWGAFDFANLRAPIESFVSVLGAGVTPGPATRLSPSLDISQAAPYGRGRVALATPAGDPGPMVGSVAGVATGPLRGPLRIHRLPAAVRSIAGNRAGDLAVLIEHCATRIAGCHPSAPAVVVDRPGRGFGRPITLDRQGHSFGGSLAIDAHGRVLAAWDRAGVIHARFVSASGRLTPIQRLGSDTAGGLDVVLSDDGRAAVGWTTQTFASSTTPAVFAAKVALAGPSGRFGVPETLERGSLAAGGSIPYDGVVVRLPAGEPGLAAWTGYDGSHFRVEAASILGTAVGPHQTVSTPGADAILGAAAEGAAGQAVVLVLPGQDATDGADASRAGGLVAVSHESGTQTFGAQEEILPGSARVDGVAVSIDAATGIALATWRGVDVPAGWSTRLPLG